MTKVDERSVVPPVDAAALERLGRALDRDEIVAAFVFGSQAAGTANFLSDIDVAVWLRPEVDDSTLDLQLKLMVLASRALHTDEVDVVILNRAPPLLQQRAMETRLMAIERDFDERVRLETRALLDYLDTQPLRDIQRRALFRRIDEGTFGRS